MTTGQKTIRLPVRSALSRQRCGELVVRWVTTSEYPLFYVFCLSCSLYFAFVHIFVVGFVLATLLQP